MDRALIETPLHPSARKRGRLIGSAYVAVLPDLDQISFGFKQLSEGIIAARLSMLSLTAVQAKLAVLSSVQ